MSMLLLRFLGELCRLLQLNVDYWAMIDGSICLLAAAVNCLKEKRTKNASRAVGMEQSYKHSSLFSTRLLVLTGKIRRLKVVKTRP